MMRIFKYSRKVNPAENQVIIIIILLIFNLILYRSLVNGQANPAVSHNIRLVDYSEIQAGADRTELYFPLLAGKSIGIVCNHTSLVRGVHLLDTLVNAGFDVKTVFAPEHGFRGGSEAGADITDETDTRTGVHIVSLYGMKKAPAAGDLAGTDLLIFDIQDVGVRFYTYISTLSLVMKAAEEQGIPVIVLDRPNPNGFYVDGPVLDTAFRSFVGMHPVPVVYGMTIGEYARMINEEGWAGEALCSLTVIPMAGYDHNMIVKLPVKPSPNLPDWKSVYLYPSLCFFEGTIISVGRGTDFPFQIIGHPEYVIGSFIFVPRRIPGVAEQPPFEGRQCYGHNLAGYADSYADSNERRINLFWLIGMYNFFKEKDEFFTAYFDKLAGTDKLRKDIIGGMTEDEIRKSWEDGLSSFRKIREKYLLYP